MIKKVNILSTRVLNSSLIQKINTTRINFISNNFIDIKPIDFDKTALFDASKNWVYPQKIL